MRIENAVCCSFWLKGNILSSWERGSTATFSSFPKGSVHSLLIPREDRIVMWG